VTWRSNGSRVIKEFKTGLINAFPFSEATSSARLEQPIGR
jgi:hypothetical protein